MLEKFRKAKADEIKALHRAAESESLPAPWQGKRVSFSGSLRDCGPGAVIAEYKRASPSKGEINLSLSPEAIASKYAASGAAAISVLTERTYFKGELGFLKAMTGPGLPLLRKDFLFDPLQVAETAATPASALLLIVRMFENSAHLAEMINAARKAGLESVVEIFAPEELEMAREAGADIIQVNNRDLDTLATDLDNSREMIRRKGSELWICASGIETSGQVREMAGLGFDAVLVGTSLMRENDPGAALKSLTGRKAK